LSGKGRSYKKNLKKEHNKTEEEKEEGTRIRKDIGRRKKGFSSCSFPVWD